MLQRCFRVKETLQSQMEDFAPEVTEMLQRCVLERPAHVSSDCSVSHFNFESYVGVELACGSPLSVSGRERFHHCTEYSGCDMQFFNEFHMMP